LLCRRSSDTNQEHLGKHALPNFYKDYVVISHDRSVSRGFLDGLETLINHTGNMSDLAQAAKIVSLATTGNKLCRMDLVHYTKQLYGDLLGSFHSNLLRSTSLNTVEALMTAVLLGIYEVVLENFNSIS
jgi:hypothetical protein